MLIKPYVVTSILFKEVVKRYSNLVLDDFRIVFDKGSSSSGNITVASRAS